jgi:hypothetical protein
VHGRDAAALAQVRAEIEADGGTCRAVTGDLTVATQVADIVREAVAGFGGIDVSWPTPADPRAGRYPWSRCATKTSPLLSSST